MKKFIISFAVLGAFSNNALADTITNNVRATATLTASCTISATDLEFGEINPVSGPLLTVAGTLTTRCSRGVVAKAAPDFNSEGFYMIGQVKRQAAIVHFYNHVTARNIANWWGSDRPITINGTGSEVATNYYGEMRQNQYNQLTPDNYSKSVVVTLTF